MESKRDWHTISTNLQLGEIPSEEMPRLLFECIQDLKQSQEESSDLVDDIKSTITTWLDKQIEKRTKGDNHESSNGLEQEEHELRHESVREEKRDAKFRD